MEDNGKEGVEVVNKQIFFHKENICIQLILKLY